MSETRIPVRQKDRIHAPLGSVVTHRLAIDPDLLYAIKAEYSNHLVPSLDTRGCKIERQSTLPIRRYPKNGRAPRKPYQQLLDRPLNMVTTSYTSNRFFGEDAIQEVTVNLANDNADGAANLRMITDKAGDRRYFLRRAVTAEGIKDACHTPLAEKVALSVLSDVIEQNAKRSIIRPKEQPTIAAACLALDGLAHTSLTVRRASYETFSDHPNAPTPSGSASIAVNHYERLYPGDQRTTDFSVDLRSLQPLDASGSAFIATRMSLTRDEVAHRPVADVQLGVQVNPGLTIGGLGLDEKRRDTLCDKTLAKLSQADVFVDAMRRNLDLILM